MPKALTKDEFVARCTEAHGTRYEYSKTNYVNHQTSITIICPEHGEFVQTPKNHLYLRQGCPDCGRDRGTKRQKDKAKATFISKAQSVHNQYYDYSKALYISARKKVTIICPVHGVFSQTPNSHLRGSGCYSCGRKRLATAQSHNKELFVRNARAVHGARYGYTNVEYMNARTNVQITCSLHGDFAQWPSSHLAGRGCPTCGLEQRSAKQRITTQDFKKRAKDIHGNSYNYSKVEYVNAKTNVIITCTKHGDFSQAAGMHLAGQGCRYCGIERGTTTAGIRREPLTSASFVERAKAIWGDQFDYTSTAYVDMDTPVTISCPTHGKFVKPPHRHIYTNGPDRPPQGCQKCAKESQIQKLSLNTTDFVNKANRVHNNYYGYEKVEYRGSFEPVEILCPSHGYFSQAASNHLRGAGCQRCADEIRLLGDTVAKLALRDRQPPGNLYVIEAYNPTERFWKVGITTQTVQKRFQASKIPYDYDIGTVIPTHIVDAYLAEQDILKKLYQYSYIPNLWFEGHTECLSINPIEHDPWLHSISEIQGRLI